MRSHFLHCLTAYKTFQFPLADKSVIKSFAESIYFIYRFLYIVTTECQGIVDLRKWEKQMASVSGVATGFTECAECTECVKGLLQIF